MSRDFIIIDPDPIVSMDLEEALAQRFPDGNVSMSASVEHFGVTVAQRGSGTTLFVKSSLLFGDDDLAGYVRRAASAGCLVVLIGQPEVADTPWPYIEVPFTTEMIHDAVDSSRVAAE